MPVEVMRSDYFIAVLAVSMSVCYVCVYWYLRVLCVCVLYWCFDGKGGKSGPFLVEECVMIIFDSGRKVRKCRFSAQTQDQRSSASYHSSCAS